MKSLAIDWILRETLRYALLQQLKQDLSYSPNARGDSRKDKAIIWNYTCDKARSTNKKNVIQNAFQFALIDDQN